MFSELTSQQEIQFDNPSRKIGGVGDDTKHEFSHKQIIYEIKVLNERVTPISEIFISGLKKMSEPQYKSRLKIMMFKIMTIFLNYIDEHDAFDNVAINIENHIKKYVYKINHNNIENFVIESLEKFQSIFTDNDLVFIRNSKYVITVPSSRAKYSYIHELMYGNPPNEHDPLFSNMLQFDIIDTYDTFKNKYSLCTHIEIRNERLRFINKSTTKHIGRCKNEYKR